MFWMGEKKQERKTGHETVQRSGRLGRGAGARQSSVPRLVRSIWSNTAVIIWWSPRIEASAAAA